MADTNYGNYEDMYKNYPEYFGDNDDFEDMTDRQTINDCVKGDKDNISLRLNNFIEDLASEYYDTSEWGNSEWDRWFDAVVETL